MASPSLTTNTSPSSSGKRASPATRNIGLAAEYQPSREFASLRDATSFQQEADSLRQLIREALLKTQLDKQQQVAFYPFDAAEAMLLEVMNPDWQRRYFAEKFFLEGLFVR